MGNWLYLICIISCICKVVLGDVSDEGLCLQPGVRFLVARLLSPWRDRCDWVMRPSWVWCQSLQAELVQRWVRRGHFLFVDSSSNVHIETLPHFPSSGWWALRHPYLICRRTEEEVEGTPLYEKNQFTERSWGWAEGELSSFGMNGASVGKVQKDALIRLLDLRQHRSHQKSRMAAKWAGHPGQQ